MASFVMRLPDKVMSEIEKIYENSTEIFGSITRAGANVTYKNVKINAPQSFKKSRIMQHLQITKTYRTSSDHAINTKVGFYGYFTNRRGKKTPAPLVAKVFEYGRSDFLKQPFFRKSFNRSQIYKAMIEEQKKVTGGILNE